jgi:cysteine protease ATG4
MLRTGQSLLANCLVELMLGRDFRPPHAPPLANPSQPYSSCPQPQSSFPPSSFPLSQDTPAPPPLTKKQLSTYIKILTWFLDTPSPSAPFSVHRLALAGKELGKDVGMWFGPSTAAGGIRQLVHAFPEAGLGVCVASDGVIYQSDVYNASQVGSARSVYGTAKSSKSSATGAKKGRTFDARHGWGDKAVLILLTTRLGIEGVNPVYYETIKTLYTFPQSVGIAGGRPSSSYYFVGSQADNLFYLDPHHARPTVPLRPFPPAYPPSSSSPGTHSGAGSTTPNAKGITPTPASSQTITGKRGSASSASGGKFAYDAPSAASSVVADSEWTSASGSGSGSGFSGSSGKRKIPFGKTKVTSPGGSVRTTGSGSGLRSRDKNGGKRAGTGSEPMDIRELYSAYDSPQAISEEGSEHHQEGTEDQSQYEDEDDEDLTAYERHLINSYSASELRTFHCERVRKMPLSGLDPSMLIGFLVKSEDDWLDLRRRIGEMSKRCKPIFSVQDEPPNWPSDSDDNMGLESISEPDDGAIIALSDEEDEDAGSQDGSDEDNVDARRADRFDEEDEEEDDDDADVEFFDTRSASASISSVSGRGSSAPSKKNLKRGHGSPDDNDTEDSEDATGPITPGPNTGATSFEFGDRKDDGEADDIEDDWIDPSVPTPRSESIPPPHSASMLRTSSSHSSGGPPISGLPSPSLGSRSKIISPPLHQRTSSSKSSSSASGKKKKSGTASTSSSSSKLHQQVPVPVPFPVSVEDEDDYERDFEYVRAESASPVSPSSQDQTGGGSHIRGGFPVLNEDELEGDRKQFRQNQQQNQHSHPSSGGRRPTAVTVTKRNTQPGEAAPSTTGSTGEKRRGRDGGRTQSGGVKAVFES